MSGTCNTLFLGRGDKKLYNLFYSYRCVGGRIALGSNVQMRVWFFANVTDPFNITIINQNKKMCTCVSAYITFIYLLCWKIYTFDEKRYSNGFFLQPAMRKLFTVFTKI